MNKTEALKLVEQMGEYERFVDEPKVKNWLEANTEKFMRAWLDGFEIELEEQVW